MAVCPKCSSQVADGTKFCPACGSAIGSVPGVPGASTPPSAVTGQPPGTTQGGIAANVAAMLTYIPVCLVGLVCAILFAFILDPYKKDRFIRFHAWQSLAAHAAILVLSIGWTMVSALLTSIVHLFALITFPVSIIIGLGGLVLMIILMIKAYNGETYKLPLVGDWAEKQAGA